MAEDPHEILRALQGDEPVAKERLIEHVYDELRSLAAVCLRGERAGHTLQPTALVNEALARLIAPAELNEVNRDRFVVIAAHVMRQVLVDHARKHNALKRGGEWQRVTLGDVVAEGDSELDLVLLDRALEGLAQVDERMAKIVELQYFGGLTGEEAGRVLGVSRSTVKRELSVARAWLRREIDRGNAEIE